MALSGDMGAFQGRCLSGSAVLHCAGCLQKDESKERKKCIHSFLYAYSIQKEKQQQQNPQL